MADLSLAAPGDTRVPISALLRLGVPISALLRLGVPISAWLRLGVPGYPSQRGCAWGYPATLLSLAAPRGTHLSLAAPGGTRLPISAWLRLGVPILAWLRLGVPILAWLRLGVPGYPSQPTPHELQLYPDASTHCCRGTGGWGGGGTSKTCRSQACGTSSGGAGTSTFWRWRQRYDPRRICGTRLVYTHKTQFESKFESNMSLTHGALVSGGSISFSPSNLTDCSSAPVPISRGVPHGRLWDPFSLF